MEGRGKDGHKEQDVHTTIKRCQEGKKKIWQTVLAYEQIFDHFATIAPNLQMTRQVKLMQKYLYQNIFNQPFRKFACPTKKYFFLKNNILTSLDIWHNLSIQNILHENVLAVPVQPLLNDPGDLVCHIKGIATLISNGNPTWGIQRKYCG